MIKVAALNKAFGGLQAVSNLSFEAAAGCITSIIGPNGAGKSTAFNLIAGTLRPDSGRIELDGREVTGQAPFALTRLGVARSFRSPICFSVLAFSKIFAWPVRVSSGAAVTWFAWTACRGRKIAPAPFWPTSG